MSYHKLDKNGKPIPNKGRKTREPAMRVERNEPMFHYEFVVTQRQDNGKLKYIRKRFWLPDDAAAAVKERDLKGGGINVGQKPEPEKLTWIAAHRKWMDSHRGEFSPGHVATSQNTMDLWCEAFGKNSTIEGTSLASFTSWIHKKAKEGTGRAAQVKREHMLAIARWCRARGLVEDIPFEHSPKPKARTKPRRSSTGEEFLRIADVLPADMVWIWRLLGLSGLRLSAALELQESDIIETEFTVLTKYRKHVTYPITGAIRDVIDGARRFKAECGIISPLLFTKRSGKAWKKDRFNERLQSALKAHGLPKITAHQLRHMAGTLLAESNMSADIIQAGLAHDSRASAETYIDKTQGMRKTALDAIAAALENVKKMSKTDVIGETAEDSEENDGTVSDAIWEDIICPHCHRNHIRVKE